MKIKLLNYFRIVLQEGSTSIKVKCTAMLQNVYLKSNEISFEVKPLQNMPALEIREKNGKNSLQGKLHNDDIRHYEKFIPLSFIFLRRSLFFYRS